MMDGTVALLDEAAFMMDANAGVANESGLIMGGARLLPRVVITGVGGSVCANRARRLAATLSET